MSNPRSWIYPDWPAPDKVKALCTVRLGGVSQPPYDSFNLAMHVGDDQQHVAANRKRLVEQAGLPAAPFWLNQVHSNQAIELCSTSPVWSSQIPPTADASYTRRSGIVLSVMTADCLPILLCNTQGTWVAAIHAGWRGLAAGIVSKTVQAYRGNGPLLAWLGPAISQDAFEVGAEVLQAFVVNNRDAERHFIRQGQKYHADLYALARDQLRSLGVTPYGGNFCTYHDKERFFSYRRDGETGRMASLIWIHGDN
jgi:hypothetical protein